MRTTQPPTPGLPRKETANPVRISTSLNLLSRPARACKSTSRRSLWPKARRKPPRRKRPDGGRTQPKGAWFRESRRNWAPSSILHKYALVPNVASSHNADNSKNLFQVTEFYDIIRRIMPDKTYALRDLRALYPTHTYATLSEAILNDPATRTRLTDAIAAFTNADPVDAYKDATLLAELMLMRTKEILNETRQG